MPLIVNLIAFQINWFACVLGGAYGLPCLGVGTAAAVIAAHLAWAAHPKPELILILTAGAMGLVADSLLVSLDLLRFTSGTVIEGMAPYWIIAMWMAFATTLNVTFRWLKGRVGLAALLGAAGGPLAYYGGSKLGGVSLLSPAESLVALAITWGLAMPTLVALAARFDGTAGTNRKTAPHSGSGTTGTPA